MNPERWPGEPLRERLTIEEINEVQRVYVIRWRAQRRRDLFDQTRKSAAVKRFDMQGRRIVTR